MTNGFHKVGETAQPKLSEKPAPKPETSEKSRQAGKEKKAEK